MFKSIVKRSLLGAVIGVFISHLIAVIISLCVADGSFYAVVPQLIESTGSELNAVLLQTVCSVFYGAMFAGVSVIWELDNWSILKQTVVHFLVVSIVTLPVAYVTQWMHRSIPGMIIYFGIFTVIYAFIWFGQYMAMKKNIVQMNTKVTGSM